LSQYTNDELDGLAVIDAPKARAAYTNYCELAYDPFDTNPGGELSAISGSFHLGNNVLVAAGSTNTTSRLIAYDATTCAFLQQVDVPSGFEKTSSTVIVPLTGWSIAKPLDNVEYLRVTDNGISKALSRYDATGTFVQAFPITNTDYDAIDGVVYSKIGDQVYVLLNHNGNHNYRVFPRPAADVTSIDTRTFYRTHPCGYEAVINGTDAAGNLYIAQLQGADSNVKDYRVCTFTPQGELLPAPYAWTTFIQGNSGGFIVPGASHFLLHAGDGGMLIERGAYQAP
jgi:hypothetical protein